jgi:hypothetical protein
MTSPDALDERALPEIEILGTGRSGRAAIVIDFAAPTAARRIGAIVRDFRGAHTVCQLDPAEYLTGVTEPVPFGTLTEVCARSVVRAMAGFSEIIVVGYCSAALLALRISEHIAENVQSSAVLITPTRPDSALVREEYLRFREDLGAGAAAASDTRTDRTMTLTDMMAVLDADLHTVATRKGLPGDSPVFREMLDRYRAWLSFLSATSDANMPVSAPTLRKVIFDVDGPPSVGDAGSIAWDRTAWVSGDTTSGEFVSREIFG